MGLGPRANFPLRFGCALAVVGRLVVDVVAHGGVLGLADGERAIGALPAEGKGWREDVVDQVAGNAFELADQVGDRQGGGQADEDVNVVGDAADVDAVATELAGVGGDGGVNWGAQVGREDRCAVPGRPYEVDVEVKVGFRHRLGPARRRPGFVDVARCFSGRELEKVLYLQVLSPCRPSPRPLCGLPLSR